MNRRAEPMSEPLDVFACPLDGVRLVEASAGTGKTWNICGLYLRMLAERGLEVQRILVVTFTKAATAELKDRIRARLAEVAGLLQGGAPHSPDPFARRLVAALQARGLDLAEVQARFERALRNFDEAAIFTIHGFCQRALDDTPLAAGLPLRQELVEDDGELRAEAARDFWRREIAGGRVPAPVARWMQMQGDTPEVLARLLQRQAARSQARVLWPPGIEQPAEAGLAAYVEAFGRARELWLAERRQVVDCVIGSLESLRSTSYNEGSVGKSAQQWDEVFASSDPLAHPPVENKQGDKLKLLTREWYGRQVKAKPPRPCLQHDFFTAAQAVMDAWTSACPALGMARLQVLHRFLATVPDELRERKRRRRLVSFDDMLANLHERLLGPSGDALAAALGARFPAALVDEFQDTDPLQFAIFHRVYGAGGSMFLVGDPKQAIYSFRNADLQTYLAAARTAQARYTLADNQRSSRELIDALNAVFGANPQAFMLEGLGYEPVRFGDKKRKPFEDRTRPGAALQLWDLSADGPLPDKTEAGRRATEACAAEIARLLAGAQAGQVLHGDEPLTARDIAVLVRTHREARGIRAALAALGVGSVELAQASVFDTPDAEELERVLAAVLEPVREGLVRAALATQWLGFDARELERLAGDEPRMAAIAERFASYRQAWSEKGVGSMLRALVVGEGVERRMLARTDGERRLTNLRHLAECLHEAAQEQPGPEALLRWLRQQRGRAAAEATQVRLESDQNLVQIVTIHKAKGLEYPVVFCPFLWNGHLGGGGGRPLPGLEYHDDEGRVVLDFRELDDAHAAQVKERVDLEQAAERLRLVYVALTRAVHRCYLVVGSYVAHRPRTESGANPLHWLAAGAGFTPRQWRAQANEAGDIAQAWARLAQANAASMRLDPLPRGTGQPVLLPRPDPATLAALAPPARIPFGWQLSSYSSLAYGAPAGSDAAAADRDARAGAGTAPPPGRDAAGEDDILRFVAGARAGETMHAVFERIDFARPEQWSAGIHAALKARPPGMEPTRAAAMLQGMARDVLATPLPGGIVLSQVRRRVTELEFAMSAPALSQERLLALLARSGYPPVAIRQSFLSGYLQGFIDLVFEHEGRFHVLDWKSTHLGWQPQDYSAARMQAAIAAEAYHLQYLLYTVAVHRWLSVRHPGYDYDRHFGGVFYLFVRGVRPHWRLPDGSQAGVFHDRPSRRLVEALDAVLQGRAAP